MEPESPLAMEKLPVDKNSTDVNLAGVARILLERGVPTCLVTVDAVSGSAPRDAGTMMLVTGNAFWGTIGGGKLEYLVLEKSRELIRTGQVKEELRIALGPEINQCCGGKVSVSIRKVNAALLGEIAAMEERQLPKVQIHGAGHTGKALARALTLLPFEMLLVDVRENALTGLPSGIGSQHLPLPESAVRDAAAGTAFVVLTHSHDLDFLIAAEALARGDAAYVGLIGSATKRRVFTKWLGRNGYEPALADGLTCPIGGTRVRDKRPEVIAALVAAELLEVFAQSET